MKVSSAFFLLLVCGVALSCLTDAGIEDNRVDFGHRYSILDTPIAPVIKNDSLIVRLAYSGCSGDHAFLLRHRISGSSQLELWIQKETPDQMCEAYWTPTHRWRLPDVPDPQRPIMLLDPSGGRFPLR